MEITGMNFQNRAYSNNSTVKTLPLRSDFTMAMTEASKQIDKQKDGKVLRIAMLEEPGTNRFWGMKAMYASCSTKDNPVIYVESNYGGETVSYNVNIKEVSPKNASRIEMFALCAYLDDIGEGDKSTFGTYVTLRSFEEMAGHNGYIDSDSGEMSPFEEFKKVKLNWVTMSKRVTDLLYECNDIKLYKKGLNIINMFSKHIARRL